MKATRRHVLAHAQGFARAFINQSALPDLASAKHFRMLVLLKAVGLMSLTVANADAVQLLLSLQSHQDHVRHAHSPTTMVSSARRLSHQFVPATEA
jgi:hypothetical protein